MQAAAPALRRAAASLAPRASRRFGSGPPGGWFSEGTQTGRNGYLFGETPPPPGQRRQWELWEAPWCVALASLHAHAAAQAAPRFTAVAERAFA